MLNKNVLKAKKEQAADSSHQLASDSHEQMQYTCIMKCTVTLAVYYNKFMSLRQAHRPYYYQAYRRDL